MPHDHFLICFLNSFFLGGKIDIFHCFKKEYTVKPMLMFQITSLTFYILYSNINSSKTIYGRTHPFFHFARWSMTLWPIYARVSVTFSDHDEKKKQYMQRKRMLVRHNRSPAYIIT